MRRTIVWTFLVTCVASAVAAENPPVAAGPTTAPATAPATTRPALVGLDGLLSVVPAGVLPGDVAGWTSAKMNVANAALADLEDGTRRARLTVRVRGVEGDGKDGYTAKCEPAEAVRRPFDDTSVTLAFDASAAIDAARLRVGEVVTVTGNVSWTEVDLERPANDKPYRRTFSTRLTEPQVVDPSTRPTSGPAVQELGDFLAVVPAGVTPADAGLWTEAKASVANASLAKHRDRVVRLQILVSEVESGDETGVAYAVTATDKSPAAGVENIVLKMTGDAAGYAAQLNVGTVQTFDATVSTAAVTLGDRQQNADGTTSEVGTLVLTLTAAGGR